MNPWIATSGFAATVLMNMLHAICAKTVGNGEPAVAATTGTLVYVISAYAVIEYTQDWRYVGFMVAGFWIGTYVTLRRAKKPVADVEPTKKP